MGRHSRFLELCPVGNTELACPEKRLEKLCREKYCQNIPNVVAAIMALVLLSRIEALERRIRELEG
ncbi:MAG: hypothetical protein H8E81_09230 [Deltaproteobacteria bacterium]|nr:hypothetical protein [Deltaproteobacteria bacterium]